MLRESRSERGDSSVQEASEVGCVVYKLHFRNHVDQWCKANCNPRDRNELYGVSVCLSVCPSVFVFFLGGEGGGRRENI